MYELRTKHNTKKKTYPNKATLLDTYFVFDREKVENRGFKLAKENNVQIQKCKKMRKIPNIWFFKNNAKKRKVMMELQVPFLSGLTRIKKYGEIKHRLGIKTLLRTIYFKWLCKVERFLHKIRRSKPLLCHRVRQHALRLDEWHRVRIPSADTF